MNIYEATKLATEKGGLPIYQRSHPILEVTPTDTDECCVVTTAGERRRPRWNPKLGDFLATDWEVKE